MTGLAFRGASVAIIHERLAQREEFTFADDDALTPAEWVARITKHTGRAVSLDPNVYRKELVIVGALALAALESSRDTSTDDMAHTVDQEQLRFFDDWEDTAIRDWSQARGDDDPGGPTVCGSCCGFYEQEFWVTLTPTQVAEFNAFAKEKGIEAEAYAGGIRIG